MEEVGFEEGLLRNGKKALSVIDRIYQKYDRLFEEEEPGGATFNLWKDRLSDSVYFEEADPFDRDFYALSDDDDSEPDPVLAALLREQVVKEKQAINWDEVELKHKEKVRKKKIAVMEAAARRQIDSDSECSDKESPPWHKAHGGSGSCALSLKRAKQGCLWGPGTRADTAAMDESVDIVETSVVIPSETDGLSVVSAPECNLDNMATRDCEQHTVSMYELGGEEEPRNNVAPFSSSSMFELRNGAQNSDSVIRPVPDSLLEDSSVNQGTDNTLTPTKKESVVEGDPYLDLQSGYETSVPASQQHHSTPKVQQRVRRPFRGSPAVSMKLDTKTESHSTDMEATSGRKSGFNSTAIVRSTSDSQSAGMEPRLNFDKEFDSHSACKNPEPTTSGTRSEPIYIATSSASDVDSGSVSEAEKSQHSDVESDAPQRTMKTVQLKLRRLPYDKRVSMTDSPVSSCEERVLMFDPLVHNASKSTTTSHHSTATSPPRSLHDRHQHQITTPTQAQHHCLHGHHPQPAFLTTCHHHHHHCTSRPSLEYHHCSHTNPPPPTPHNHHFCTHSEPVMLQLSNPAVTNTTTPASTQTSSTNCPQHINYCTATPHYGGCDCFGHSGSCCSNSAITANVPCGWEQAPSNARESNSASKRPLESSSSSESLPFKRSKKVKL